MKDDKIITSNRVRKDLKAHLGDLLMGGAGAVVRDDGRIFLNNEPLAVVKYFPELKEPLFRFAHPKLNVHLNHARYNGMGKPPFTLHLSSNGLPGLMIVADTLTFDSVVKFIMEDMFNRPVNTRARTRVISKNHTVLDLEFWEPKYAQDWVDILNAEFDPQAEPASEEKRRYPAYWVNKEVYYAIGEDTYRVKVVPRIQVRTNGYVDLQDDRLQMFHYEEGGSFQFTQHNAGPSEKLRKDVDSGDRLS